MPSSIGKTPCWPRGYCAAVFLIVALGLHIASVLTPIMQTKEADLRHRSTGITYDEETDVHLIRTWLKLDYASNNVGLTDSTQILDTKEYISGGCQMIGHLLQVGRAMFFSALGFCVLAIPLALSNALAKLPSCVTSVLIVFALMTGLIGWAVAFAMWNKCFCDHCLPWKDVTGSKIGPSTPCLTAAWFMELFALILSCACEEGGHDSLSDDGSESVRNRGPKPPKSGQVQQNETQKWHDKVDNNTWYTGEDGKRPDSNRNRGPRPPKSGQVQKNQTLTWHDYVDDDTWYTGEEGEEPTVMAVPTEEQISAQSNSLEGEAQ